jgi:hypothetical protein
MDTDELRHRFAYHAPVGGKAHAHELVRSAAGELALGIDRLAPDCREKSLAITALEESMMWANALARNPEVV